jgi:hypothetical protein
MPSPFPGMDPYLEGELWTNFHTQFAVAIAQELNPRLAPHYVAVTEKYQNSIGPEEIAIATDGDFMAPDVSVSEVLTQPAASQATAVLSAPLRIETVISIPVPHVWIKILDRKRRRLVTAIEFLSPVNKRGQGRVKYLRKRRRLLLSQAHLMEIDLLRKGKRVPMAEPLPSDPYFVFLRRVAQRPALDVWPIAIDQPLPKLPVPLLPADDEQDLDLQKVFDRVYDCGSMEYLIDYQEDPDVPLNAEQATWADSLLAAIGK